MNEPKTVIFTPSASGTGRELPLLPPPPRRMQKYPHVGKFGFAYQSAMWREYERQRIEALVKRAFGPTPAADTQAIGRVQRVMRIPRPTIDFAGGMRAVERKMKTLAAGTHSEFPAAVEYGEHDEL